VIRRLFLPVVVVAALAGACTGVSVKGEDAAVAAKFRDIGSRELAIGQDEAALNDLLHARDLDPTDATTHHLLGLAYLRLSRYAEAERALQEALSRDPNMGPAHNSLGTLYSIQHKDAEAAAAFHAALAAPGYATPEVAHGNLGQLYARQGDALAAAAEMRAAVEANPAYEDAYLALADLQLAGGETAAARSLLEGALTRFPASARVHLALGKLLIRTRDYRAALRTLKEGQKLAQEPGMREQIAQQIDILE